MSIPPWWDRFPGLREAETAALDAAGLDYQVDEDAERRGTLRIHLRVPVNGETTRLVASYPDLFPYFRFEIQAPDLDLGRHQNPFSRALCMIGRGTANWEVDDTLASFIVDRLDTVIDAAADPGSAATAEAEERQGEPFSDYFSYQEAAVILVDGHWDLTGHEGGSLMLGVPPTPIAPHVLRGAVLSVQDADGHEIAAADPRLARHFETPCAGRWVRLDAPPEQNNPEAAIEAFAEADPSLSAPSWEHLYDTRFDVVGAVFPEEVQWRAQSYSWLFVVRVVTQQMVVPR